MSGVRFLKKEDIPNVAKLHSTVLPHSPAVKLGLQFLSKVYYPALLTRNPGFCLVYDLDGMIVGFICGSTNSSKFSRHMIISGNITLCFVLALILLKNVFQIKNMLDLAFSKGSKAPKQIQDVQGRLLSFGIYRFFRHTFDTELDHSKISNDLFERFEKELQKQGISNYKVFTHAGSPAVPFYKKKGLALVAVHDKDYFFLGKI